MTARGRSLYTRLAIRLGLVLAASAVILLGAIVLSTRLAASNAYDRILTGSALQIAENTWYRDGVVNVDVPLSAFSMLTANDQVFYAVRDPAGRLVAGDADFRPAIPWEEIARGPVVVQGTYLDFPVSIAFVGRRMPVAGANPWAVVMLAQTNNARESFAKSLGLNAIVVIGATGILTVIAALFTLFQALAPLKDIGAAIQRRAMNDLSPLAQQVPAEIHPLVASLNGFMHRLAAQRALMRRVIGDAAHQLRTPVAALTSQMEMLSMQTEAPARAQHLARARELTRHLGELVNQLINHAMVQHRADSVVLQPIDLVALVREEMRDMLAQHAQRMLDVELAAPASACMVMGDAVTLREAFKNVLSNALQYGAGQLLHVAILRQEDSWAVQISDDGPGIDAAHWERVKKPFSARDGGRTGASLGLSIVDEVMRAHDGRMQFGHDAAGQFYVSLILPVTQENRQVG